MIINALYRISNGSYDKDRIATKERCLQNFVETFLWEDIDKFYILMDNCNLLTQEMIRSIVPLTTDIILYSNLCKVITTYVQCVLNIRVLVSRVSFRCFATQ